MRVKGGFSRAHSQKSLELYAREELGEKHFLYPFFEGEVDYKGEVIDKYKRIRLRNGGSDREAGFIRDELSQALFRQAGHADAQSHVPAAVFLNGEYYGVAWLKSPRTVNHLSRKYGGKSSGFEIVGGGDNRFIDSWWVGEERAVEDLFDVFELASGGLTDDERFAEFCDRVDLDGLIRYYAMQIYINNQDWPNHNIEMFRYFPTDEEKNDPALHEVLRDGKWRFWSHDIEAAWSIWDDGGNMARADTLRDILDGTHGYNGRHSSTFLYYLLEREDMRERFADTFEELIEGAFSPENVAAVLESLTESIQKEHEYALRMNLFVPDNLWWPSVESVEGSRFGITRFARKRPEVIRESVAGNLVGGWD
jgi:hypothetical protein